MLNRIVTGQSQATTGATCWGYSYTVDNWGNRTNEAVSKCSGYNMLTPADTASKNRIFIRWLNLTLDASAVRHSSRKRIWL